MTQRAAGSMSSPTPAPARCELVCVRCRQRRVGTGYATACAACGGLLDAEYDLARVRVGGPDLGPLRRFADLLPMPAWSVPAGHGVRSTPLFVVPGAAWGVATVLLKWEGAHPTGSTKDAMAAVALADLYAHGVRSFAFSSTGNTTAAFAQALLLRPEMTGHVFVPAGFPEPDTCPPNLIAHPVPGDYVIAQQAAKEYCRDRTVTPEGGFASVGRREGLKMAYLEALLAAPEPVTVVVQSVSSGMGLLAAAKAIGELRGLGLPLEAPRLVGAQQASCAPMVSAFRAGSPAIRPRDIVASPTGRAMATLLGDPSSSYPYVYDAVRNSGGTFVAVFEEEMVAARDHLLGRGLDACFSAATALGALRPLVAAGFAGPRDVVLVNLTGSSRSLAGRGERRE